MPIDYKKYPANWKTEIRPMILKWANNCCEFCGVENGALGYRDINGKFWADGMYLHDWLFPVYHTPKQIKIVLTIAHLNDPDPMNCHPLNLAALCQQCHNRYDAKMRARNRKRNFEKKHGILKLFEM
ncbi:MAG: hypothetical protein AAF587_29525 [Bacteroidota bacterium]